MGGLHPFVNFTCREIHQVLTVNIRENSPHSFGRRRGKGNIKKIYQSILSFLIRLALRRNYFIRA